MRTSEKISITVFSVLLVAVVSLLVYLNVTGTQEITFKPNEPSWDIRLFPLTVQETDVHSRDLVSVIGHINDDVGFEALTYSDMASPSVNISFGVAQSSGHPELGTSQRLLTSGLVTHCNVTVSNVPTTLMMHRVIYHELGHCLGLAHDTYTGSIMFRHISDRSMLVRLSDADRGAIRERYKR